ncbi:MAG: ribonuclease H-like domain-containing protein [Kiritimatiellae bacterium]|nr:ribonuclease H-like domain-containing protein [Kiritimatiellia bacterium]
MTILDQSLCMLQGVSPEAEIRLRRAGVMTCAQLAAEAERYFSASHAQRIRTSYEEWQMARAHGLVDWEISHLPSGHRVRALWDYWNDVLFYDIETDGTMAASNITCISTLRNGRTCSFWRGHNLPEFLSEWAAAKILVSFNGKRFDTPIVCKTFGLTAVPAQIDLMNEAAHYGYRGGLKMVEKSFGFVRKEVGCTDGKDAIRLWNEYSETHSKKTLSELLEYNQADVASLVPLARGILHLSLENTLIDWAFENSLDGFR